MLRRIIILVVGMWIQAVTPTLAKTPAGDSERSRERVAQLLENTANRTGSLEVFGEGILRQALNEAAGRARSGARGAITVEVPITVRIIPMPQPPETLPVHIPSPYEIDVCWEMSNGIMDYVNCSAPIPPGIREIPPLRVLPDSCDSLWARYKTATGAVRFIIVRKLLELGCTTWAAVRIDVDRPVRRGP